MRKLLTLSLYILILSSCGSARKGLFSTKDDHPGNKKPKFEYEDLENDRPSRKPAPVESDKEAEDRPEKTTVLEDFIDDWYGTPHRMGGMTKKGVDCSGFVIIAYEEVFGLEFKGRRAEDIFAEMEALSLEELEYGDLVFFKVRGRRIDHVGIYLEDLKFAHTSSSRGVMISSLSNPYWQKRFFKGGRHKN